MMRYFLIVVFLVALSDICSNGQNLPNKEKLDFFGNVKSIKTEFAKYSSDGKLGERIPYKIEILNNKGALLRREFFNSDGSPSKYYIFEYNRQGKIVSISLQDDQNNQISKQTYTYEKNRIKEIYQEKKAVLNRTIYHCSNSGRSVKVVRLTANGEVLFTSHYKIDSKGNLISFSTDNNIPLHEPKKETYKYDAKGFLIERLLHDQEGAPCFQIMIYENDNKGNPLEIKNHNCITHVFIGKTRYDYEYDALGNWIKRTELLMSVEARDAHLKPTEVVYRTISYY